ncbi:MAG: methyltransferase domain-containing protein [Candidatus Lokiarchaeota archaeon]|nr:methyltransferase domain-containing protein [Candidatus Lokiarchaeota archaeon]
MKSSKFREKIQSEQYKFPYHYLLDIKLEKIDLVKRYTYGFEQYALLIHILKILIDIKPKSIIDVGCGDGKLIYEILRNKFLKKNTDKVVGIDYNKKAILFAKAFNLYNKAIFIEGDAFDIKNGKFDVAILMEVLEHISPDKIKKFIKGIYKNLKDISYLIISTPSTNLALQKKHYMHYNYNLMVKTLNGLFSIQKTYFIGSTKKTYKIFKYIYLLTNYFKRLDLTKYLFSYFNKKYLNTSEDYCIHLIFLCKKIKETNNKQILKNSQNHQE